MMHLPFLRVSAFAVGAALMLTAPSCTTTVAAAPVPPPPVTIRVDRARVSVPQGTTFDTFAERERLRARDGRLLSVAGAVLERHVTRGRIDLNGTPPDPFHLLRTGDRIAVIDGIDRVEDTRRVVTPMPGRSNAFVQHTLATYHVREIAHVGRISGDVADVRFENRDARTPDAVALTFDDGPWPGHTEALLGVLRRLRVRATFFRVGSLAAARPGLVGEVLEDGHVVANHSFDHPASAFAGLADRRVEAEIARTAEALRDLGANPTLFRPPGGSYDDAVVLEAWRQRERVVMWSVDPHDWDAARGPAQIAKDVLRRVRPGSIVLLHDGGGDAVDTIAALPKIVRGIRKMGLELVTLDPYRRP
jgi:peptidoglycan/xylan/chitin deacetylase (PgdA/CDA1 family)